MIIILRRYPVLVSISGLLALILSFFLIAQTVHAADASKFNPGYIISDEIFYDSGTMSLDQIQQFLVSKVPTCDSQGAIGPYVDRSGNRWNTRADFGKANGSPPPYTCLKDYKQTTTAKSSDAYCNGFGVNENQMASQIIFNIAKSCGINPKVLITLLQKEQGLVTDDWPWPIQYRSATGMGCPDKTVCDSQYYGFFNQLYGAARQFKMYKVRYNEYNYQAGRNNFIKWHPDTYVGLDSNGNEVWEDRCGGSTVFIQNQATAGLYNYTPFRPNDQALAAGYGTGDDCSSYGNRNFYLYFNDWFGSSTGDTCPTSLTGANTDVMFQKEKGKASTGQFVIYSGTSTGCVEFHAWNAGETSWKDHIASNSSAISTNNSMITFADIDGDGKDEGILIGLRNTGSGKIEFHIWDSTLRKWREHIISNSAVINPAVSSVTFADVNGDGKDEGILIGQGNGSTSTGKIEFHVWNYGLNTWREHIISNSNTLDMGVSSVTFADVNGDGKDEGILIGQGNGSTSTGKIEFHVWNYGLNTWREHIISNSNTLDPNLSAIRFADTNGDNRSEGILIGKRTPTGSGKIEFHVWNYGLNTWREHIISNQPAPSQ